MYKDDVLWIGSSGKKPVAMLPAMANRHGLIAGATGTGKTTTLKVMVESFSDLGVPVFLADIKGDLASLCQSGAANAKLNERLAAMGAGDFSFKRYPVQFWDVFGEKGHPARTTISEMGPLLLSRLLGLNDTQRGVLSIIFKIADEENLLLLDMKDLQLMLQFAGDNAAQLTTRYGNISKQSVGAIQRAIGVLEQQGGEVFFGEPAIDLWDWIKTGADGRGIVNVLDATKLFHSPDLYASFLLFLLSELFEKLPEVGDLAKPRIVFFFDEAHLLFKDMPKILVDKIEQVVRLVRSKGVGVYFITQNPLDLPESVLGQLGNRVQHALRAYTPLDQKAVRAAAQTFRANPAFNVETVITELETGEALLSFLDAKGAPGIVERAMILPPQSCMGAVDEAVRQQELRQSPLMGKYERAVDRESAYESLTKQYDEVNAAAEKAAEEKQAAKEEAAAKKAEREVQRDAAAAERAKKQNRSALEKAAASMLGTAGRQVTRSLTSTLMRGIMGSLLRK
jgi:DNA helicase HerA-like ATPase